MRSILQNIFFVMLLCATTATGVNAQVATVVTDKPD
jgi:hypothetical protein